MQRHSWKTSYKLIWKFMCHLFYSLKRAHCIPLCHLPPGIDPRTVLYFKDKGAMLCSAWTLGELKIVFFF